MTAKQNTCHKFVFFIDTSWMTNQLSLLDKKIQIYALSNHSIAIVNLKNQQFVVLIKPDLFLLHIHYILVPLVWNNCILTS